jgi:circadian clock protein KaiB
MREIMWKFRLYVAGGSPHSRQAIANLEAFCQEYFDGVYNVEIIDLLKEPKRYKTDGILVTPTLIRYEPDPVVTLMGNLSDREAVLLAFGLKGR